MDGVPFKVTGRDDYCFEPHGNDPRPICLDLKTTHRVPSDMLPAHKRQMSLYQAFRPEHRILICYVSTKKHAIYELDLVEVVEVNKEFVIAAQAIERLLNTFDDPMEIGKLFALNIPVFTGMTLWCVPKPSAFGDIDGGFKGKKE